MSRASRRSSRRRAPGWSRPPRPGTRSRRWTSPSARATPCGSAASRPRSGRRPAIAPTTSPTGSPQAGLVCAGDTLFTLGCGRVMESPPETLYRSLRRFDDLPDATQVFSGHDYVLANARFALAADPDNPALQGALRRGRAGQGRGPVPDPVDHGAPSGRPTRSCAAQHPEPGRDRSIMPPESDPEAVFVALRAWKNRF